MIMSCSSRRKLYAVTAVSGLLSISSYIFFYTHQDWVITNFTRGGIYALLPIMTAFYFSLIHGTFTSCLLDVFGFRVAAGPGTAKEKNGETRQNEVIK